jgi:hypothetical protein
MNTMSIAAASVIGREHRRLDRPCQDAFAIRRGERGVVAVVCDGCGSGAHSELGARLGANLVARILGEQLEAGADLTDVAVWRAACDEVVARLAALVPDLDDDPRIAIGAHLLFTVLAVALLPEGAAVLAIGDGVVIVDGDVRVIESENNAPAYLGYELLGPALALDLRWLPGAQTVVIASDGALPIVADLVDLPERVFANRDALRRQLWLAGREPGLLADDTTVVAVRRNS